MSLLINIAAQFSGKKALKDAQKQVNVLEQSVKKLGATLGVSLSAAAVVAFGKASVKAFAEDEKAASRLAGVLDNLGLSFANLQVAGYIEELSRATGVVDDDLRPAFQALITTTGSLTNSQKLLAQAVDISAGSGENLTTVANDLAQAYVGNTRGLRKYNLGLTQAELKAASFADIQERLTKLFSGANAKYLETYAGKMQVLSTAAGEAQETIGQGLVDALIALNGNTTVEDLATDMQNFATYTANTVRGLGLMIKELNKIPGAGSFGDFLKTLIKAQPIAQVIDALQGKGAQKQSTGFSFFGSPMETTQKARDAAAAAKAEADAKKRAAALLKSQKANTAELKKQSALKKAGVLLDMDYIQLIAALKGKLSDEERKRVELQLALLTGNEEKAKELTYEIGIAQGLGEQLSRTLASMPAAKNPFAAWEGYLDAIEARVRTINLNPPTPTPPVPPTPPPATNVPTGQSDSGFVISPDLPGSAGSDAQFGPNTPWARAAQTVVVQIDGREIARSLQDQSMSAGQVAYLDRRTGGF